jgi:hypothetical protein
VHRERASSDFPDPTAADLDDVVEELRRVLAGIRHGSVTLIVQDGRIVQIDATRKVRLAMGRSTSARAARDS